MSSRLDWIISRADGLHGDITVPGDKSMSHRTIMLAAIAKGISRISGFLEGTDTQATVGIFEQLGVRIDAPAAGERIVHGVGLHGLRASQHGLDCGNSGTAMRLLTGLFSGQMFESILIGDESLSKRPMRRVLDPLRAMGARIDAQANDVPPLRISGENALHGIAYQSPIASAQVKSAVLLAGLYADGETRVSELHPTRDYTERMLAAFGWPIEFKTGFARLTGGHRLQGTDVVVPGDFSSAAFFIVAASLVPGSALRLYGVGLNPRRTGLLQVLRTMGANILEENPREAGGERIADLIVQHAPLRGIDIPASIVPDMIDEFPILFVAAACAQGTTIVRNAAELRVKESDRIAVMTTALRKLGACIEETPDGAVIEGVGGGGALRGGDVDARGDHRCAMALAIAGSLTQGELRIRDCANVATSFPGFVEVANACGLKIAQSG